ncbi:hypothetical protein DVR12_12285 [Chitinophaga silvatica]|uniref:Signal transduction histidine kinase internal region domain-containing protein n=1 Tax=Chitinophaga silvatica TaxID=2282649 RepID=A0A3E1YA23_9BACT|nr:histidine kinase [Chitinophaga silvatica]RFS22573.1 hypothetical protein DVR12_12285 [Chitinophaga silvatica]
MKYRYRIYCLFILCIGVCHHLSARQKSVDTTSINQWLQIADQKEEDKNYDSTEYYLKKAYDKAKELDLPQAQIKCLGTYSQYYFNRMRYQDALRVSEEQLDISLKSGNMKAAANAYNNIAIQQKALGQLQLATENLIKGIKIGESLKDSISLRRYYNNLSSIFLSLNDAKNSLYYSRKSYEIALLMKDSLLIANSMVNLATSEVLILQYDSAIVHLKKVTAISERFNNTYLLLYSYVNIGDIYNKILKPQIALEYYEKANRLLKYDPDPDFEMYTNCGLAYTYYNLHDYTTSRKYFDLAFEPAKDLMPKTDLKELYQLGANIHEKLNNPAIALKFLKLSTILNDSILNEKTQQAIHDIEIKYQTSNKEKAIVQQQLQISNKNIELQNKNKVILSSIVVITLLVSGCIIIYLIYRNKNQLIELNLLKAQIHPHFLFNTLNNLYALSLNKSDKSPGVVLELSQILRYILYECNTATVNLDKELIMIERYISLEKIRYENHLEVNMVLEGELDKYNIVPLLLLPLVENSFKHGISKLMEDGWINISAKMKGDQFTFKISNNKLPESDSRVQPSAYGNIGLFNIRKRLDILYPGKHDLKIIDEDDVFVVVMKITLQKNNAG